MAPVDKSPLLEHYLAIIDHLPLLSVSLFIYPTILYYQETDYVQASCLFVCMLLRMGYYIPHWKRIVNTVVYDISYVLVMTALHFHLIYTGMSYRNDITSSIILLYLIKQSFWLLMASIELNNIIISKNKIASDSSSSYTKWNIYMFCLLVLNWSLRDVSNPIVMVDFIKGLFWGSYLCYCYNQNSFIRNQCWHSVVGEIWKNKMKNPLESFFGGVQMAPFIEDPVD
jgi:hypothetical protein